MRADPGAEPAAPATTASPDRDRAGDGAGRDRAGQGGGGREAAGPTTPGRSVLGAALAGRPAAVLELQRTVGNRAFRAALRRPRHGPVRPLHGPVRPLHGPVRPLLQREPTATAPSSGAVAWIHPEVAPGWPAAPADIPHMEQPLLDTLMRSFYLRTDGEPSSQKNLDPAFWGGTPKDLWDAVRRLGADGGKAKPGSALDVLIRIYDRWKATGLPWDFVFAVKGIWAGSSDGFNFNSSLGNTKTPALEAALEKSAFFCKDHVGGLYHCIVEASTPCFREIVDGRPGLHVCTGGRDGPTVHIDPHQIVQGKHDWLGGYCDYDLGTTMDHFRDLGWLPSLSAPKDTSPPDDPDRWPRP